VSISIVTYAPEMSLLMLEVELYTVAVLPLNVTTTRFEKVLAS
jgi:hypothetical protein